MKIRNIVSNGVQGIARANGGIVEQLTLKGNRVTDGNGCIWRTPSVSVSEAFRYPGLFAARCWHVESRSRNDSAVRGLCLCAVRDKGRVQNIQAGSA